MVALHECRYYYPSLQINQQLLMKSDCHSCPHLRGEYANKEHKGLYIRKFVPLFTKEGRVCIYQVFKPAFDENSQSDTPDLSQHCYVLGYIDSATNKPKAHMDLSLQQVDQIMKQIGPAPDIKGS